MSDLNVTTQHEIYQDLKPKWDKSRIVNGGEDAVHAAGEALLPKLPTQDDTEYKEYKERTRFLPALKRTVKGLKGEVTRKDPIVHDAGESVVTDNINGDGANIFQYGKAILEEVLLVGVCGTLVDYADVPENITIAAKEERGLMPNFSFYKAESIINWKYDVVDNVRILVMVVLKEWVSKWVNDFETKAVAQYRVLRLTDGIYTQQMYTVDGGNEPDADGTASSSEELIAGEVEPIIMNGDYINEIPFYFHGDYENPPLYDLVTTNIKHYQLKAGHNHALYYVGLPTPIFPGVDPDDPKRPKCIGPSQVIHLSDYRSKPYYMTYGADGIESIERELATIKEDMAFLGASMIASDQMLNETATKTLKNAASETSVLGNISENLSITLTNAYKFLAEWQGVDDVEDIYVEYSKDFNPLKLSAQELTALVLAWQSGAYSKQTLFKNLQEGEIIDGDKQFEDEEEEIQNQVPTSADSNFEIDEGDE